MEARPIEAVALACEQTAVLTKRYVDQIADRKADKTDIAGGITFRGSSTYSALPSNAATGDCYYCSDGDGTNGAGLYARSAAGYWCFAGAGENLLTLTEELEMLRGTVENSLEISRQLIDTTSPKFYQGKRWNSAGSLSNMPEWAAVDITVTQPGTYYCSLYLSFSFIYHEYSTPALSALQEEAVYGRSGKAFAKLRITEKTRLLLTVPYNPSNNLYPYLYRRDEPLEINTGILYPVNAILDVRERRHLPLQGKKYAAVGDSITEYDEKPYLSTTKEYGMVCRGYQSYVAEALGCTKVNMGVSGGTSADMKDLVLNTDFSDIAVCSIMTGVNDYGRGISLADYRANLGTMIEKILGDNPECQIVLLSHTFGKFTVATGAGAVGYLDDRYVTAMRETAESYGIPFYDNYHQNGINQFNLDSYMVDDPQKVNYQIHPNYVGHMRIGRQVANFMKNSLM